MPNTSMADSFDEDKFQSWYKERATKSGIDPNPDDPAHKYDYRKAYSAGVEPAVSPEDGKYHWDSRFKAQDHPNRFVNGIDTITGEPAAPETERLTTRGGLPRTPMASFSSPDGTLSNYAISSLAGDTGQRLGYTPARDEGALREFNKGFYRGGIQFVQSMAKTFGADETDAGIESFLSVNRQLFDSDRKSTWSYITNVAGSQIAQNLPMLAVMFAAGAVTGGVGGAAVAGASTAGRTLAIRGAGAAMTGLMQWGSNLEELRQRLPDVPESTRIAMNMFLTPLQAWIEVGLGIGGRTSKEIARYTLANALAKRGGLTAVKKTASKVGRLTLFRETLVGKWLETGVEETFEEFLQNISMDALVNVSSTEKDWDNEDKWDNLTHKYKQLFQEAFIGGMALGGLPATMNSFNNMAARRTINNALKPNPDAQQKVDAGGVKVNGVWIIDPKRQQDTIDNFNGFFANLGEGQLNPDPTKRTSTQNLFTTMFYNLAAMRMDAETDHAKRAKITPEDSVKELTILLARNPAIGPELINEMDNPEVTMESIARIVNKYDEKLGVKLGSVKDVVENGIIRKQIDGYDKEFVGQIATDQDNEEVAKAFKTIGGVAGRPTTIAPSKSRAVPTALLEKVAESVGDGFSRVLAIGWVHNVVIGQTEPVSIKLDIDEKGRLSGVMYSKEEAAEQEDIKVEGKEDLTDTGLTLAKSKVELGTYLNVIRRLDSWKTRSSVAPTPVEDGTVVPPAVEPSVEDELPETTPEDTAQRLKFLQDIKAEIAKIQAEDIAVVPSDNIEKFEARKAKAVVPAEKVAPIEEPAPIVDNTIGGQIAALEKEILMGVKGLEKSKSDLAAAEKIRRKTEKYFEQFVPKAVGPVRILHEDQEKGVGAYLGRKDMQLMAFFSGADLGTFTHELVHHFIEQELLPTPMMDALRNNFVLGVDKDRRLNQAEKENIANSFLQYVMQSKLPKSSDVSKAFGFMKAAIQGSARIYIEKKADGTVGFIDQFQSEETGRPEKGASFMVLKPDTQKFFQSVFANVTEDEIVKLYGSALRDSLLNGQVSDKYYFDDAKAIETKIGEIAADSAQTPRSVMKRIFTNYADALGGKTDISKLDADERYVLNRILEDELKAINPDRVPVAKDRRVSWERTGKRSEVFVKKSLIDSEGNIYDALPGETQHFQIETRVVQENPALKTPGSLTSGYKTVGGKFVDALTAEKDGLFSLEGGGANFEMQKRRDASGMPRSNQNSFFHRLFVDEGIKDPDERQRRASEDNHEFLQALGFPANVKLLTDEQVVTAIEAKQSQFEDEDVAETEAPKETAEMTPELRGVFVDPLSEGSAAHRFGKKMVSLGRRISVAMDARSLVEFLTDKVDGAFKKYITDPLTNIINENEKQKVKFYGTFDDLLKKHNVDKSIIYDYVKIGGKNLTKSTLLDIYFMSNYGTQLDNNSMTKFKVSHPEFFPNGENTLVNEIIEAVKSDSNLLALGNVMQEMNDLHFDMAASVKEILTGERPIKVAGAYTSERTKDGLFIEMDEKDIAKQLEIYVPGLGKVSMEPDALKHRGDVASGEYNLDSFGKFISHIESLINYQTKAQDIFRMLAAIENTEMRSAFQKTYGNDRYRLDLIKLLRREMSSAGTLKSLAGAPLERGVAYITNKAYTAFLSWNPMTILTQLTTVFPAISALGVHAAPKLISNIAAIMKQAAFRGYVSETDAYKLVNDLSPAVFGELFPGKSRESIKELLEYGQDVRRGISQKGSKWLIKYEQMGMRPMAASDAMVRLATYQTAYEMKVSEQKYSGKTEQEISDTARHFAEAVIRKSHNPASRSDRGLLQSESSAFLKSTLAFTSQPFAMMKMFITDVYSPLLSAYQKSGLMGMGKEIGTNKDIWRKIAVGGLLPGIALGAIGRRRPQKNMEELLKDSFFMGLGNLVPVLGQMLWASAILGWGSKGGNFGGIYADFMGNVTDTITGIIGQKPAWDTVKSARRTITLLSGFPDWPVRVLEKLYGNIVIDGGKFNGKTLREATLGRVAP